ncbi:MAG: PIN domain-containing protein [Rubrivivax sp.]|nr:PIN domain-containing protein [Rubrivivax sp.]
MVLDTNAVLDWLVFRDPGMQPLGDWISRGMARWVTTAAMRIELAHMLGHRSLHAWKPEGERVLSVFDSLSRFIASPQPARVPPLRCSDADDQMFIDLALSCPARWLITRDRALLKLARRARALGVEVLTPPAWCARHAPAVSPPDAHQP